MPRRPALTLAASAVLIAAAPALSDVFFEITPVGQLPNGVVDSVPLLVPGFFDVYVWGSGNDTGLLHTDFSVAAVDSLGWLAIDLGIADPDNLFPIENHGAFGFFPDALLGIAVQATAPVPLPQDMASAMKIYSGFAMRPDIPLGMLEVYPVIVSTNTGGLVSAHTTGLIASPAPGAAALLALGALSTHRRRRR